MGVRTDAAPRTRGRKCIMETNGVGKAVFLALMAVLGVTSVITLVTPMAQATGAIVECNTATGCVVHVVVDVPDRPSPPSDPDPTPDPCPSPYYCQ